MAEVNSKRPEALPGWYSTETEHGLEYVQTKGSTKYGNPGGDALIAQGYKFVGAEDPRLEEVEEAEEVEVKPSAKPKASKAKK